MAGVTFQNVSKSFGETHVIRDISLDIADKEFLVLVGPSGCGKSTLLRMAAGLEDVTGGSILIGGRQVDHLPPKDRDIAMVFQNYALYPHMNVYKNMAFGLKMRRFAKDEIDKRVREAAKILEIEHLLDRKPFQLSGGQRQRVAMGRAIVRKPKAFLFDEPLSNLDAKLRVQMRLEIKKLHERLETTVIYVTHDQVEAMTLAQRIAVLHEGVLQQAASPLEVYNEPTNRFVAGFIGSPTINLIEGVLRKQDGAPTFDAGAFLLRLPDRMASVAAKLDGQPATAGIRPEHLHIVEKGGAVRGVCDVTEPLGSEIVVFVKTGEHLLAVRADASKNIVMQQSVELDFEPDKIKLFDHRSGTNLIGSDR